MFSRKSKSKRKCETLALENAQLKKALRDTLWMAAEYAKQFPLYGPYQVNRAIDTAATSGIDRLPEYVDDEKLGSWNPSIGYFDGGGLSRSSYPRLNGSDLYDLIQSIGLIQPMKLGRFERSRH